MSDRDVSHVAVGYLTEPSDENEPWDLVTLTLTMEASPEAVREAALDLIPESAEVMAVISGDDEPEVEFSRGDEV